MPFSDPTTDRVLIIKCRLCQQVAIDGDSLRMHHVVIFVTQHSNGLIFIFICIAMCYVNKINIETLMSNSSTGCHKPINCTFLNHALIIINNLQTFMWTRVARYGSGAAVIAVTGSLLYTRGDELRVRTARLLVDLPPSESVGRNGNETLFPRG